MGLVFYTNPLIQPEDGIVIIPSSGIARIKTTQEKVGEINGIPVYTTKYEEVIGLPEAQDDVIYIVSTIVAQVVKRKDVVAPDTNNAVRDEKGNIVVVKAFQTFI